MPQDAITVATLQNMAEGGFQNIPTDSQSGQVWRPVAVGQPGGRTAPIDSMFTAWIDYVGDPDESLQRNPGFFEKIGLHPVVQGAIRKRQRNVASFPDSIIPNPRAQNRAVAKLVANYVGDVWSKIPSRHQLYENMQLAVLFGGMGIEWIWHRDNTGAFPIEYPVAWFPMSKTRFVFDRLMNMSIKTRETSVWGSYVKANDVSEYLWKDGKNPPLGKFCYHTYQKEPGTWENPGLEGYLYYGKGEVVPLYYVVTFDWYVLNQRVEWLQTFSRPARILWYPDNDPLSNQTPGAVAAIQNQSVITLPRTPGLDKDSLFAVEQMEVPHASYDAMENFQKWCKDQINIILLGSAEEQQQGEDGKGGYSSHVSRHESGPKMYYAYDAMNIESTINNQLIPAIVWWKFPNLPLEYMPRLKLDADQGKDRKQEVEILKGIQKLGLPITVSYAQQQTGAPPPEKDEALLQAPAPAMGDGAGGPPGEPGSVPPGMKGKAEPGSDGGQESVANEPHRAMPRGSNGQGPAPMN